jgi:EVE domain
VGRTVNRDDLGAWMVKGNPAVWDFTALLRGEMPVERWSVQPNYRSELAEPGDRVFLWLTGGSSAVEPGLWGAGAVTGRLEELGPTDEGHWRDEEKRRRSVHFLPMRIDLWGHPLSPAALRAAGLGDLEVLRQPQMGNPLHVTRPQLEALDRLTDW